MTYSSILSLLTTFFLFSWAFITLISDYQYTHTIFPFPAPWSPTLNTGYLLPYSIQIEYFLSHLSLHNFNNTPGILSPLPLTLVSSCAAFRLFILSSCCRFSSTLLSLCDITIRFCSRSSDLYSRTSSTWKWMNEWMNGWMNEMHGVLGHDSALLRLHWAGDNLG